jgi:hypothetical protein
MNHMLEDSIFPVVKDATREMHRPGHTRGGRAALFAGDMIAVRSPFPAATLIGLYPTKTNVFVGI